MAYPENDSHFYEETLEKVEDAKDGMLAITVHGGTTWIPKNDFEPKAGMKVRIYGRGFGYPIRGVFIDGHKFTYMTIEEEDVAHKKWVEDLHSKKKQEYEKNKANIEKRFEALPEAFKKRIQRFRDKNPEFIWDEEPYEMFCCEQAVVIANALKASPHDIKAKTNAEIEMFYKGLFTEFMKSSYDSQRARVPKLDDGHSGNTFSGACNLAYNYLISKAV